MSESLLDFDTWPTGIASASIPANNNARRAEVLAGVALSATTTAQPGSPAELDIYIIPAAATGAMWSGFTEDDVAIYSGGTWTAFAPFEGLRKFVADEGADWQYVGGLWSVASVPGAGDVVGPASAVTDTVALYDGTTGKLLKAGSKTVAQLRQQTFAVACSDLTTNLTTGTGKAYFYVPYDFTITEVQASVDVVQTAGSLLTIDINESGTTILSTKLTLDNNEGSSITAATAPVISDSTLTKGNKITFDIDQVGTAGAKGLIVYIIGYPT